MKFKNFAEIGGNRGICTMHHWLRGNGRPCKKGFHYRKMDVFTSVKVLEMSELLKWDRRYQRATPTILRQDVSIGPASPLLKSLDSNGNADHGDFIFLASDYEGAGRGPSPLPRRLSLTQTDELALEQKNASFPSNGIDQSAPLPLTDMRRQSQTYQRLSHLHICIVNRTLERNSRRRKWHWSHLAELPAKCPP